MPRRSASSSRRGSSSATSVAGSERGERRRVATDCRRGSRRLGLPMRRAIRCASPELETQPASIAAARSVPAAVAGRRSPRSAPTRSAGGPHDFFLEGDYWWPDPKNPDGPCIRRDGESNPDNFVEHRRALVRLSVEMPALTARRGS